MALFDFYTIDGALIFTHPRGPSYPVEAGVNRNVVSSTTVGGKVMSESRGDDRRRLVLRWQHITAAHLASFLSWHATYGANKLPFRIELPADLTDLSSGTLLPVRSPAHALDYRWTDYGHYALDLDLVEDLHPQLMVTTLTGSLALTGITANRFETYISPTAGSLALTGIAPSLRTPESITPTVAALAAAGVAPTLE